MQTNSLLPPGAGPTTASPGSRLAISNSHQSVERLASALQNFMIDMQPSIEAFARLSQSWTDTLNTNQTIESDSFNTNQTIELDTVRAANRRHAGADGMRQVMTNSTAKRLNDDQLAVLRRERGGAGQARAERRPKRRPMATLRSDDTNAAGSRYNNAAAKDPAIENDRPSPAEATAHRLKSARRFKSLEL